MTDPQQNRTGQSDSPSTQPSTAGDGTPKFGRLLIVLILVVIVIGVVTYASEALYS